MSQTELTANLHVHSTYSDGTRPMAEVIAAAKLAGLDVLLFNDHDTLAGQTDGFEGYHGRVLVIVGYEISGPHNHYLVYGPSTLVDYDWREPQEFIDRVREDGGIGFIAHPFEQGSPLSEGGRAFTWDDWSVRDFDGLEIWNYSSSWKAGLFKYSTAILRYFQRRGTVKGPDRATLAKWDELGQTRRVPGVGGSDAHAFKAKLLGFLNFTIFEYEYLFRAVNTHLLLPEQLTGDYESDRAAVIKALAEGSCFISHDRIHPGRGFDFRLENDGRRRCGQGGEVSLEPGDVLVWNLPARARFRVIRDGTEILNGSGSKGLLAIDRPGVYRLEADRPALFFGPRPWLFSNPVYVRATAP